MKSKFFLIIGSCLLIGLGFFFLFFNNDYRIELLGNSEVIVDVGNDYVDSGYIIYSNNRKIKNKATIDGIVDVKKIGKYELNYEYKGAKKKRIIEVVDREKPVISLKGSNEVVIYVNENYIDDGVVVTDNYDVDLSDKIVINGEVDNEKVGEYSIVYSVTDRSNNKSSVKRIVKVINRNNFSKYMNIDNTRRGFGFSQYNDNRIPLSTNTKNYYKKYNAFYVGDNEKKIYLTFDEGGNPVTYVKEIVDILNKYNIKGTFFFCYNYIRDNYDLMNKIVDSGHVIGNHTINHYGMHTLANSETYQQYLNELKVVENEYKKATGKTMMKLFRYPSGEYSERTLTIMKDLGYKTIFWSFYYDDWSRTTTKEYSLNIMKTRLHNGAIYLIHPKNKGNYEALEEFILYAIENGYKFDLVSNL